MDINCDLGEGAGNDHVVMRYLGSCNIACGGHTGDLTSMTSAVKLAKTHRVKVGAHPSFMDRQNFGRKEIKIPRELLKEQILNQVKALDTIVKSQEMNLHHIKPHGALYNMAANTVDMAELILEVMNDLDEGLLLYVPFNSRLEKMASERNVPIYVEIFADRNYNDDFSLVSRSLPDAVINDPEEIMQRVKKIVDTSCLTSINGVKKMVELDTICIHGDHPNVIEAAKLLYDFKNRKS